MPEECSSRIVVIGASHAGISFVDQMRKYGFDGDLTLVDRQKGGPMERPPLSKEFLLETDDKPNPIFLLKRGKWYKEKEITLKHGVTAIGINPEANCLTLATGEKINFDKLVLATGAVPRSIPATKDISNVFVLRQPDDAIAIRKVSHAVKSAVIIGGGYIGLEVAASFRKMGLVVNVIEAAERLLARVASPPVANILANLHLKHGVTLHTGISVDQVFDDNGSFSAVKLANGEILEGEMLVVGIGVTPDSWLARQAGIDTENSAGGAILVNASMRTSIPNIFAIGDVALKRGEILRIESVHNAKDSAARAAAAIMGQRLPDSEAPRFWSDQYDANLQSVGIVPTGVDDVCQILRPGKRAGGESFWSYQDNKLLAVEAIRDIENFVLGAKCLDNNFSPDPNLIGDPGFNPMV